MKIPTLTILNLRLKSPGNCEKDFSSTVLWGIGKYQLGRFKQKFDFNKISKFEKTNNENDTDTVKVKVSKIKKLCMICMNLIFDLLLEIQCSIKMLSNLFHKFTTVSEKFGYDFNIGTQAFTKQCVIIWHQP